MGIELAKAWVTVRADTGKLKSDFRKAEGPVRAGASQLASLAAGIMGAVGVGAFLYKAKEAISLAERQVQAEQRVAAVIKATGGAAGFTADQLKDMASQMQKSTTFGDEQILESMAVLGTFKHVAGDVFKRTMQAAMDLSAAGFGGLQQTTTQLAKALEDPKRGLLALRRVGVTFTEEQEKQIKTLVEQGDLLKAQRLLLAAVEGQVKGTAEAMAQTPAGKLQQLKNVLGDLKEEMGKALLPLAVAWENIKISAQKALNVIVTWVSKAVTTFTSWDKATGGALSGTLKFAAALAGIAVVGPRVLSALSLIGTTIKSQLIGAFSGLVKGIRNAIASMVTMIGTGQLLAGAMRLVKMALIGTGVGLLVVAIGAAIAGLIKLWGYVKKSKVVQDAWAAAVKRFSAMWQVAKAMFAEAMAAIWPMLQKFLSFFGINVEKMPDTVAGAVAGMIKWFTSFVVNVFSWTAALIKNWRGVWQLIKDYTALALLKIVDVGWKAWNTLRALAIASAKAIWVGFKDRLYNLVHLFELVVATVEGLFKGLWAAIKSGFAGKGFIKPFMDQFRAEWNKVQGSFKNELADSANAFVSEFDKQMGRKSPLSDTIQTMKDEIDGVWKGIEKDQQGIKSRIDAAEKKAAQVGKKKPAGKIGAAPGGAGGGAPGAGKKPLLDTGRYGIPELGRTIQDALLKPTEDKQEKMIGLQEQMVGLAEEGNQQQKALLDEMAKTRKGAGAEPAVALGASVGAPAVAPAPAGATERAGEAVATDTAAKYDAMIAIQRDMRSLLQIGNKDRQSLIRAVGRIGGPVPAVLT